MTRRAFLPDPDGLLVQFWLSLPLDSKTRISDAEMNQAFLIHCNPNEDLDFKFHFSSEFDERLFYGEVRYVVANIKSGVSEHKI